MVSKTTICSSAKPWALIQPGIKGRHRGKIHGRVPYPLERGPRRFPGQSDHQYQFRRAEQLDVSPVQWASLAQGAQLLQRPDLVREASVVEPGLLSFRVAA